MKARFAVGLLCAICLVVYICRVAGCGSSNSPTTAGVNAIGYDDVMAQWNAGSKDEAVDALTKIDWSGEPFAGNQALTISETQFAMKWQKSRNALMNETIDLVNKTKGLARHAMALGQQAEAEGDSELAERRRQAVHALGNELANGNHLLVLQQTGAALQSMAQEQTPNGSE